jgi:hypothetical protein
VVASVDGLGGCLNPAETGPYDGSSAEKEKTSRRKTEDRLDHRRKHGGKRLVC